LLERRLRFVENDYIHFYFKPGAENNPFILNSESCWKCTHKMFIQLWWKEFKFTIKYLVSGLPSKYCL